MYSSSTQRKFWTFSDENELARLRKESNLKYVSNHGAHLDETQMYDIFLTADDERLLLRHYEFYLREFCQSFEPSMLKTVMGTAFHYVKRFYLHNSAMAHHPKEVVDSCVYLACKTEEFHVSIHQFVANIQGDRNRASRIILEHELFLILQLKHLTIHNPFKPAEGFLIDIMTRYSPENPDRLRSGVEELLNNVFLTDACLLYTPSQIALAVVLHGATKEHLNLDCYISDILLKDAESDEVAILKEAVQKIQAMMETVERPNQERIKAIERKLDLCHNQHNSPDLETNVNEMSDEDYMPPTEPALDWSLLDSSDNIDV